MPARGRSPPDTSREAPIDVDEQQDVEMGPRPRREAVGGASPAGPVRAGGRFQGRPRGFTAWRTRPRTTAGLGAKHLAALPDVQPAAPVNDQCPRERAVESLIQSERGQRWPDEISQGLRLSGNLRDLLHWRIRFLFIQGGRVARDLGMVDVDDQLIAALDSLRGDVWSCVLRDSTSPVTLLLSLDPSVLDRGLGPVGNIPIPEFLWDFLAPPGLSGRDGS